MPNTYTTDENGTYIVDRSGKKYRCNVAHPLPLPEGIVPGEEKGQWAILVGPTPQGNWSHATWEFPEHTHWLARAPFPEVPRPKTQAERDREEFEKTWHCSLLGRRDGNPDDYELESTSIGWRQFQRALAYARQ